MRALRVDAKESAGAAWFRTTRFAWTGCDFDQTVRHGLPGNAAEMALAKSVSPTRSAESSRLLARVAPSCS